MGFRKVLVVLLLSVLGFVIGYNWVILPMTSRTVYSMGMHGMAGHSTVYPDYYASAGINSFFALILLVLVALLLFDLIRSGGGKSTQCKRCGYTLKPEWVICPLCGRGRSASK